MIEKTTTNDRTIHRRRAICAYSTTNLTTSLDDEAKLDSPTMSSLLVKWEGNDTVVSAGWRGSAASTANSTSSSKSSCSVEDRACKALVHFAPQEIFEATCELIEASQIQSKVVKRIVFASIRLLCLPVADCEFPGVCKIGFVPINVHERCACCR